MKSRTYLRISAAIFAVVAIGHAARLVLQVPAHVGAMEIPTWVSWLGCVGAGFLSVWGFRVARRT